MPFHGKNFIGQTLSANGDKINIAYKLNEALEGKFISATEEEVKKTAELASLAFKSYPYCSGEERATFLDAIADEILNLGDALIQRVMAESALPEGRVIGERGRTIGQLKLFASYIREGSWVDAIIDTAQLDRAPIPKQDIRRKLMPLGPVVVFAASNFPLAFSVAGGDTASALAGGNPVIVKAHSGHLGTSELIAGAIISAAKKTNMPDGVFSLLHGSGREVGQSLVKNDLIKAVGFTGSYNAGRTLFDIANARKEPIPVFAEMGSTNPVILLPSSLAEKSEELAKSLAGSITQGTGQFCTNPGLIIAQKSDDLTEFIKHLSSEITSINPSSMLNKTVYSGYDKSYKSVLSEKSIKMEGTSSVDLDASKIEGKPTVVSVSAKMFIENNNLHQEVFGPFSMIVICDTDKELHAVTECLEGQLTGAIFGSESELKKYKNTIHSLTERVGRIMFNNVPTGVEVCGAMQHGGPFPASTNGASTSVGTEAIKRFVRPVAFQNWPNELLPDELKNENPLNIWRRVDSEITKK